MIKNCKSCGAPIVWLRTKTYKTMPVDAASVEPGDTEFDIKRHVSHFATCPDANHHRRKGK